MARALLKSGSEVDTTMLEAVLTAPRLDDALALAKSAFGPDALILSSRRIDNESGAPVFEVRATRARPAATATLQTSAATASIATHAVEAAATKPGLVERVLRQAGVDSALSAEILAHARGNPRTLRETRESLVSGLAARIAFGGRHRNRIAVFVGPTGVGKTTTIAKLAARDALIDQKRVALLTTDYFRVGGVDQLARYAELIEVPLEIAHDGPSFARSIERLTSAERIYIDTSGRSPRDASAIDALSMWIRALNQPVDVHLCLAAATRPRDARETLARHSRLGVTSILATKIDETSELGTVLSAQAESGVPLSWITNGQRVPEDIEIASPASVAGLLVGEGGNP